jgi:type IV pilus assembly protein PilC
MLVKVLPELQKFLQAMDRRLPPMTQMLLDVSAGLKIYGPHLLIMLAAAAAVAGLIYRTPRGRLTTDRYLLRLPLVGQALRLAATAAFTNALGILLRSGIAILDGLRTVEKLHRNRFLAECVARARTRVLQGGDLATGLEVKHAFSPLLPRMVAVGEAAGTLDDVLDELTRFHEAQLQIAIRRLSALIEPAIIVVVGGLVGFVYIAFFIALFSAGGVRGH